MVYKISCSDCFIFVPHTGVSMQRVLFLPLCVCEQNNSETAALISAKFYRGINIVKMSSWLYFGTSTLRTDRMAD